MRVLVSGASGLIGSCLSDSLGCLGYEVVPLVRFPTHKGVFWDPQQNQYNKEDFEGFNAVIHLSGKSIASGRWTSTLKSEILQSRRRDTQLLSQILTDLSRPPKTLIAASAVGYYGDRGDVVLTEKDPLGSGFLARVCSQWEAAAAEASSEKTRVVYARFGTVLAKEGGALKKLLRLFYPGLGATLGQGSQYLSWVALEDAVSALQFILENEALRGPVNVTSPFPEMNRIFSAKLARSIRRPHFFAIPAGLLKFFFGQMAEEVLLASTRAIPNKLLSKGFAFQFEHVEDYFSTL